MEGQFMMLRKTMIALLATAAVSMLVPGVAAARGGGGGGGGGHGGGGGGGWHGGGGGGGWHGGGMAWHGGGMAWHNAGFAGGHFHNGFNHRRVFFVGAGPGYYDDYPYYYDDGYADDGGCYIVRQRVHTRHGWRLRHVQVCGQ
jgi:hypothetical protein